MITSSNFNISLQVGPSEGGGTENKKNKANQRPNKTCAVGGARFFDPKGERGQLELVKLKEKLTTKAPQSQSKNDTTDNRVSILKSVPRCGTDFKIDTRH